MILIPLFHYFVAHRLNEFRRIISLYLGIGSHRLQIKSWSKVKKSNRFSSHFSLSNHNIKSNFHFSQFMARPKKVSEQATTFAIRQVYRNLLRSIPPSVRFSRPAASNLRRLIRDDFKPSIDEQGTIDPVTSKQDLHLKGETRRDGKQRARELLIVLRLRRSFYSHSSF